MKTLLKYCRFVFAICTLPFALCNFQFIKSLFKALLKSVSKRVLKFRLERKVAEAVRRSKVENRRYIVTTLFGRPVCLPKQNLKQAIARRHFRKGITIEQIEQSAYFITGPTKSPTPKPMNP